MLAKKNAYKMIDQFRPDDIDYDEMIDVRSEGWSSFSNEAIETTIRALTQLKDCKQKVDASIGKCQDNTEICFEEIVDIIKELDP